jgi:sulfide:quinone oxidoreductase
MRPKIVVLGSSFGGFHTACKLRKSLGKSVDIHVVSREDAFVFIPSLPWVMAGTTDPDAITFPVERRFKRLGVGFSCDEVVRLDPARNLIHAARADYPYDYLVIATGAELDFAGIPGLGPHGGNSYCLFSVKQALQAKSALAYVMEKGSGSLVFGAAQGASCLGPAYEAAFLVDALLRKKGVRDRFDLSFFTNEPFLGHFGVGGFGNLARLMEDEFADRDIAWSVNARLARVTETSVEMEGEQRFANDFSLIIPPFVGSPAFMDIPGLTNPRGFILADDALSNPAYPNIYVVGVALAIPPVAVTAVPVGVPKTAQMTEAMAECAAHNIAVDVRGGAKKSGKRFSVTCIADAGDTAFYLSADPLLPPRNRLVYRKGKWAHWMKVAFEKYYMAHLRYRLPPLNFGW